MDTNNRFSIRNTPKMPEKFRLRWITKGQTKQGAKSSAGKKRKPASIPCSIDLSTFRPRPIENNFDDWLADSKLVWSQRRFEIRTKRQIKRRRKR